jgi:hypothetical protein
LDLCHALDSRIFETITRRPQMSVLLIHKFVTLAKTHGCAAQSYAIQALNTEPLALLHLATSGYPEDEARQVRAAIFSGRSLPDTLFQMGVTRAAHRRSLNGIDRHCSAAPGKRYGIRDDPMPGWGWLNAMRLGRTVPLQTAADWEELVRLEPRISSLGLQRAETASKILTWCLRPGYSTDSERFDLLATRVQILLAVTQAMAGIEVVIDDAVSVALGLLDGSKVRTPQGNEYPAELTDICDPVGIAQLLAGVSQLSGKSTSQLMSSILEAHPRIPSSFLVPEKFDIIPLDSIEMALEHGRNCNICLQSLETTIACIIGEMVLYGVRSNGAVVGTIALAPCYGRENIGIHVSQVTGLGNAEPSPDLVKLAQSLADSWTTEAHPSIWRLYVSRCWQWLDMLWPLQRS